MCVTSTRFSIFRLFENWVIGTMTIYRKGTCWQAFHEFQQHYSNPKYCIVIED